MTKHRRIVCVLSSAPMRGAASHRSEMTSQLLFGETALVREEQLHFWRVQSEHDGYEGWVDPRQFAPAARVTNGAPLVLVDDFTATLSHATTAPPLPLGASLPAWSKGGVNLDGTFFRLHGQHRIVTPPASAAELLNYARRYLGAPYLWGGRTPWGIDCSGLIQQVCRAFGLTLPRDAAQQLRHGQYVPSLAQARPGDLAFFMEAAEHVGLVVNRKKILHASGSVRLDHLTPEGIVHAQSGALTHRTPQLRRVFTFR